MNLLYPFVEHRFQVDRSKLRDCKRVFNLHRAGIEEDNWQLPSCIEFCSVSTDGLRASSHSLFSGAKRSYDCIGHSNLNQSLTLYH